MFLALNLIINKVKKVKFLILFYFTIKSVALYLIIYF
jgi:hypothetical protein